MSNGRNLIAVPHRRYLYSLDLILCRHVRCPFHKKHIYYRRWGRFTSYIVVRAWFLASFKIRIVVRAKVYFIITWWAGCLGISFLTATLGIVEVIIVIVFRLVGSTMTVIIGIVAAKLIPRTVGRVGDKAGGSELDEVIVPLV